MSSAGKESSSDEELMEDYRSNGSESAFKALYLRYERPLFGFIQKRLARSKAETVNDLFQKTWLKIHASRHRYNPEKKFSSWLFTIALNTLRDHVGSSAERVVSEELDDQTYAGGSESLSDEQERQLLLKEDWALAEAILARLPQTQREAFLLSEWEEFSAKEIGEILNISESGVRQLLFRARSNLKSALKGAKLS